MTALPLAVSHKSCTSSSFRSIHLRKGKLLAIACDELLPSRWSLNFATHLHTALASAQLCTPLLSIVMTSYAM